MEERLFDDDPCLLDILLVIFVGSWRNIPKANEAKDVFSFLNDITDADRIRVIRSDGFSRKTVSGFDIS